MLSRAELLYRGINKVIAFQNTNLPRGVRVSCGHGRWKPAVFLHLDHRARGRRQRFIVLRQ